MPRTLSYPCKLAFAQTALQRHAGTFPGAHERREVHSAPEDHSQHKVFRKRIDTELEELRTKKQEIIDDAAKKGTVIEISVVRQDMEKIKAEYQGLTKHPKS